MVYPVVSKGGWSDEQSYSRQAAMTDNIYKPPVEEPQTPALCHTDCWLLSDPGTAAQMLLSEAARSVGADDDN